MRAPRAGAERDASGHRRYNPADRRLRRADAHSGAGIRSGSGSRRGSGRPGQKQGGAGDPSGGIAGALGEGARPGGQDPRSARQAGDGAGSGGSGASGGSGGSAGGGRSGSGAGGGGSGGGGSGGGRGGGSARSARAGSRGPARGVVRLEHRAGTASG